MIDITIPNNNLNERKYILDIIFNEFLGLKYNIEVNETISNWEVNFGDKKIVIEDHFFHKYPKDLEYLNRDNIPVNIEFGKNRFTPEEDIPIVYGNDKIDVSEEKIVCGIDIFASSFFMLTRWEEYVNKKRDNHNRFPAKESLAYKNNFLDRPIVNEYIEMLKQMLQELEFKDKFINKNYQIIVTHDVDHIYMWDSIKKFLLHLARDLIRRKSFIEFLKSIKYYIEVKLNLKNDPYDTFDYLMNLSEQLQIKSYFFFMEKGVTSYDNLYNLKDANTIINQIKERGHYIGIHPTYNSYNDNKQFVKEKNEVEKRLDIPISFGRQHYLRFEVPTTWQIWEDNHLEWDSTMCYSHINGFRVGCCWEYSVFNILSREKLLLKEKPLIFMDANSIIQENMTPKKMFNELIALNNSVKKYNGIFVLLWHNSSFNTYKWRNYQVIYEKFINQLYKDKK